MDLSGKILVQFKRAILGMDMAHFKEIYQIKTLGSGFGGDIFFSCRFKTPNHKTYIMSIMIDIGNSNPHIRASIHELCDRRWYSGMVFYKKETIDTKDSVAGVMKESAVRNYYKDNKHLPYKLLGIVFINYGIKDFIVSSIKTLEGL